MSAQTIGEPKNPIKSDQEQIYTQTILLDIARAHPRLQRQPEPLVLFTNFGDSTLDFELRAFLYEVEDKPAVESDLRKAILARFRDAGINLPFPQRDVWVRNFPPPLET